MKENLRQIFNRVNERINWRNQRLEEQNIYIEKVLKASNNLEQVISQGNPYVRRMFVKDIPIVHAVINELPRPNSEIKPNNFIKSLKDKALLIEQAVKEAQNVVRTPSKESSTKRKKRLKTPSTYGDSLSIFQYVNRVNTDLITNRKEGKEENSSDKIHPFDIKNGNLFQPDDNGAIAEKYRFLLKARLEKNKSIGNSPEKERESPLKGSQTLRETCTRIGPKLRKVTKSSVKMVTDNSLNQEILREKIASSFNSKKSSRRSSTSGLLFLKIQGYESAREKSISGSVLDSNRKRSSIAESFAESYKKTFETKYPETLVMDQIEWRTDKVRTESNANSGYNSSVIANRQSVGYVTSRDLSSHGQESPREINIMNGRALRSMNSTPHLPRHNRKGDLINSPRIIKVVNINKFASGLNQQTKENIRRGNEKTFLKTNGESSRLNSQERGQRVSSPYLTSLSRISLTSERKRERTVTNVDGILSHRGFGLKEFAQENDTGSSEKEREGENQEDRIIIPSKFQLDSNKSMESNKGKLVRKTKHSMFRMIKKEDIINRREERKSKLRTSSL